MMVLIVFLVIIWCCKVDYVMSFFVFFVGILFGGVFGMMVVFIVFGLVLMYDVIYGLVIFVVLCSFDGIFGVFVWGLGIIGS